MFLWKQLFEITQFATIIYSEYISLSISMSILKLSRMRFFNVDKCPQRHELRRMVPSREVLLADVRQDVDILCNCKLYLFLVKWITLDEPLDDLHFAVLYNI